VGQATVGVIITTFNHAHFLADAISSVLAQTRQADEILVVDDGSTDDPAAVVAQFAKVRMIRQKNRGLAAARNTGLRNCSASHIAFLDADDRLLPIALEVGLTCAARRPDCAFVYGAHRHVSQTGEPRGGERYYPIIGDAYLALLRENRIGMHATVIYRRDCLTEVGGFDETLRRCEDYDLYLRISQKYPICSHNTIVAEYRMHDNNMSANAVSQLRATLAVLDRHEARVVIDARAGEALRYGRAAWRDYYTSQMLDSAIANWRRYRTIRAPAKSLLQASQWSPSTVLRRLAHILWTSARKILPPAIVRQIQQLRGRPEPLAFGSVRFGDLRRLVPFSRTFGFDRGTPVYRYYIERFLDEHRDDIRGHVLEVGDNAYTLRFGGTRVEWSDILHVDPKNSRATIVGNLEQPGILPTAAFDCIVFTQTLHFLPDMSAAIASLHNALKPGGILLLTTPGISPVEHGECWETHWWLTHPAVRLLLEERFRSNDIAVATHGNVLAATAFLYGLALEELKRAELDVNDASFPVIVTARAIKSLER
jgi:glycosyltransferase involved in cell wall biosynthesis